MTKLVQSSLQPSSLPTYRRAWNLFCQFLHNIFPGAPPTLPFSSQTIALFIAYLFDRQYASSTVTTYISALGYFHKLYGFPDPTKNFFISQMLRGYAKKGTRLDSRLPITLPLLHRIVTATVQLDESQYNIRMFQAMFLFAFYTFSRVGEFTQSSSGSNMQLNQVKKLINGGKEIVGLKVTFLNFKHSYNRAPFSIEISCQSEFCPVQAILTYLSLRGGVPGPLFSSQEGLPVSRNIFASMLTTVIQFCGLDPSRYKGHSFRIGAASHAAEKGMSDAQIRALGRWNSNAFLKYIRLQSLST